MCNMAFTRAELEDFRRFADERLAQGTATSIRELVVQWESSCEYEQTVSEIRSAMPDILAGNGRSIEEVDASIRAKRGWDKTSK